MDPYDSPLRNLIVHSSVFNGAMDPYDSPLRNLVVVPLMGQWIPMIVP